MANQRLEAGPRCVVIKDSVTLNGIIHWNPTNNSCHFRSNQPEPHQEHKRLDQSRPSAPEPDTESHVK